jgi:hypothetical protein
MRTEHGQQKGVWVYVCQSAACLGRTWGLGKRERPATAAVGERSRPLSRWSTSPSTLSGQMLLPGIADPYSWTPSPVTNLSAVIRRG